MLSTREKLLETDFPAICREKLQTLQVNLGYLCNLQCLHCHVNAGPNRKEIMSPEVVDEILAFLRQGRIETLDLTGGAPELNPSFRYLVREARKLGIEVIDRCNLSVLLEPGCGELASFLAAERVRVVASMPCYLEENVDRQRGQGAYGRSVEALKLLNSNGYALEGSGLVLDLVYNPAGPVLPPAQEILEQDYRRELMERHGIAFSSLYTLANMPIHRFGGQLLARNEFDDYMALLHNAYRQENLEGVMCRTLLSVNWEGNLYDCDFNQMLHLPLMRNGKPKSHLRDITSDELEGLPIVVGAHCYGCTAGQGSSCGGALDERTS